MTAGTDQGSRCWVKQTACICSCLMITEHKQVIKPVIMYEIQRLKLKTLSTYIRIL